MANYHPFFVKESFSCLAKLFGYYTALLAIAHCIEAVWLWLLMLQHTHYCKTLILSKNKKKMIGDKTIEYSFLLSNWVQK